MKIRTKLKWSSICIIFISILVGIVLLFMAKQVDESLRRGEAARQIVKGTFELNLITYDCLLYPGERPLKQWELKCDSLSKAILNSGFGQDERKLSEKHGEIKTLFNQIIAADERRNGPATESVLHQETGRRIASQLVSKTQMMLSDASLLRAKSDLEIAQIKRRASGCVIASILLMIMIAASTSLGLATSIGGSLRKLEEGAKIIAGGNLNYRVTVRGEDETGSLAKAFNEMTSRLKTSYASIDDLKRMEETLRQSEVKYRTVANNTYDWEFWTNREGTFVYCSPSCERLTGHSCDEFMQDPNLLRSIVYAEDRPIFDRHRREEEVSPGELQFRITHNGSIRWIGHVCQRVFDEQGKFLGVRGSNRDVTERKQAEEELRASEERLRLAQQAARVGTFAWDLQSDRDVWTPELEAIYGLRPGEFAQTGTAWAELIHPEDRAKTLQLSQQSIQTGELTIGEWRVVWPDGSVHWLAGRWQVFKDASGQPLRMTGVNIDITERKRAGAQMLQSQKTFSELVERAPFGIYVVDSQFSIAQMNVGSQTGAFQNVRPVIGRDFSEAMRILWPEPVAAEIIASFRHSLDTGEPYYSPPFINPRHDIGIVESYEWELHRMTLPDGQYGVICYYFDSTKLRTAEAALQKRTLELQHLTETLEQRVKERTADVERERRRLYDVLETVPAMVCLLTPDHHIPFANRSFREKFGEPNGRHCYEFCFGLPQPCEFCESYEALKTGRPHRWEVTTPDGSTIIDAYDFPFTDVDGSPLILEMDIDITERKRAEEALKEKARELADLSSQLVSAQENERKRVSYDLHDNVWQMLQSLRFEIANLFSSQEDWSELRNRSTQITADFMDTVGKIRAMQGDLWPYVLDDIGVLATIDWYCREFANNHSGLPLRERAMLPRMKSRRQQRS